MKLFLRASVVGWLTFVSVSAQAQLKSTCETCFAAEIISATKTSATCTAYELKVYQAGTCAHDLSHVTVAVPGCATLSDLTNDHQYSQVTGYDPTTGLTGFKVENLSNFGSSSTHSFIISFSLCSSATSCGALSCWSPQVAFKAGNCFELDTLAGLCSTVLQAHLTQKNPTCSGSTDGQLAVVIDNGTAPFQYRWSNDSTRASITNLAAGNYSVVVTDATGASTSLNATLTAPAAISVSPTSVNATCSGMANGSILLSVAGGSGSYTYLWNTGATTASLDSVKAGIYSVTVRDTSGCTAQAVASVTNTKNLMFSATQQLPSCNASNGSLTATPSGGTAPYIIKWSTGDTTATISNLRAGSYSVAATDAEGCSVTATYLLRENNTLKISYTTTPTSCLDDASGATNISVTGGTKPYSYSWSTGDTTQNLSGLKAGSYTVTVTDSMGCQVSARISIFKKTLQITQTITQPKCAGDTTGSISLLPLDGVKPFQYAWSTGATTDSVGHLAPGIYSVTVTDSTGCARLMAFSITSPPPLLVRDSVLATSCNNFDVSTQVAGGTSPYSYQWSTGAQTPGISDASPGTYSVTVTDANACSATRQIKIDSTSVVACLIVPPGQSPACLSSNNIIFTSATGASYQWTVTSSDGSWAIVAGAANDTLVYKAGNPNSNATFTLTISNNGCSQSCSYSLSSCSSTGSGGGGNGSSCADCFSSTVVKKSSDVTCATYTVTVSTNGNCRYDLSHVVVAIPGCATLTDYSDDGPWPLVVGKDPTTGLNGLKVDNVSNFGDAPKSFNITFTLCWDATCADQLANWSPVVGYKAGQCIAYDTITVAPVAGLSVYPNPSRDAFYFDLTPVRDDVVTIELYDQSGTRVSEPVSSPVQTSGNHVLKVNAAALRQNLYMYKVRTSTQTFTGRVLKID